ncbi:MAG: DUF92 domain-containing protein [Balneolaceae bacterium]|nr:MAG: DUF92 domain-containing protein [Balneolaceae bacterium]
MYRLVNYVLIFAVIYLFVLEGSESDHVRILTGLLLALLASYISFFGNWITLDAIKAVVIYGTIIFGLGGFWLAVASVLFFVTSNLLSRRSRLSREQKRGNLSRRIYRVNRRDGYQILANGFWTIVFAIGWFLTSEPSFLLASFVSVAVACADTWSTEIGTVKPGKTVNIISLIPVRPGSDGGVSLKGTVSAAAGSLLISVTILFSGLPSPLLLLFLVLFFGFFGAVLDSYLGALISEKKPALKIPGDFSGNYSAFANSLVNWSSAGVSSILALILTKLILS